MNIQISLLFLLAISPATVCLGYAWRGCLKDLSEFNSKRWRANLLMMAACSATLSQLLALGFLVHGFHANRQSFAEPASLPWAVANWASLAGWAFAVVGTLVGHGRAKRSLLLWSVIPRHRLVRLHDGIRLLISDTSPRCPRKFSTQFGGRLSKCSVTAPSPFLTANWYN